MPSKTTASGTLATRYTQEIGVGTPSLFGMGYATLRNEQNNGRFITSANISYFGGSNYSFADGKYGDINIFGESPGTVYNSQSKQMYFAMGISYNFGSTIEVEEKKIVSRTGTLSYNFGMTDHYWTIDGRSHGMLTQTAKAPLVVNDAFDLAAFSGDFLLGDSFRLFIDAAYSIPESYIGIDNESIDLVRYGDTLLEGRIGGIKYFSDVNNLDSTDEVSYIGAQGHTGSTSSDGYIQTFTGFELVGRHFTGQFEIEGGFRLYKMSDNDLYDDSSNETFLSSKYFSAKYWFKDSIADYIGIEASGWDKPTKYIGPQFNGIGIDVSGEPIPDNYRFVGFSVTSGTYVGATFGIGPLSLMSGYVCSSNRPDCAFTFGGLFSYSLSKVIKEEP